MRRFPGRRVVITGAGSGFGREFSLSFARRGWNVGVSDIDEGRADETVRQVKECGGLPQKYMCDVSKPEELQNMADCFREEWGGVDIMVNNAGVAAAGYMEEISLDDWNWIIEMDLMSVIYGCRAFIPLMKEQGNGHIVNMASCAGLACLPEMSCYNVPKAGVISLSETLRWELASRNIAVTVITPTFFETNLMDQFRSPREKQRKMANAFFCKSSATARQVAEHAYKKVSKQKLYAVYQTDGKVMWILKRMFPELYTRVGGFFYKKGLFDRLRGA